MTTRGALRSMRSVSVLLCICAFLCGRPASALSCDPAAITSLTLEQRRAYLHYYSPVILKRGHENEVAGDGRVGGRLGHDWITSFFFDGDRDLSNNRHNWDNLKRLFLQDLKDGNVDPLGRSVRYPGWDIRPTLYTAILELREPDDDGGCKSLVLLYHVYHAKQGADGDVPDVIDDSIPGIPSADAQIHDWERIEIRVDGVAGTPGSDGEAINYVTVTKHGTHKTVATADGKARLTFQETSGGRHVVVWQAEHSLDADGVDTLSGGLGPHHNELRLTKHRWSKIRAKMQDNGKASVEHRFHYAFVDRQDTDAVSWWGAREVGEDPVALASGRGRSQDVRMRAGNRVLVALTYELQDIADILPTSYDDGSESSSWTDDSFVSILMDDPILGGDACDPDAAPSECRVLVPGDAVVRRFRRMARDVDASDSGSSGYARKDWLWGTYGRSASSPRYPAPRSQFTTQALRDPSYGRCAANGIAAACPDTAGVEPYFYQHDYFARSYALGPEGVVANGRWLSKGWHERAAGGFDGRWIQLFRD